MPKNLLLVTSSYPRFKDDDVTGRFMQNIAQELQKKYKVTVLAPYTECSLRTESLEGVEIIRHTQAPFGIEFSYGSGIVSNLMQKKWKLLFLPFFFMNQWRAIDTLVKKEKIEVLNPHWLIPQGFLCVLYKRVKNPALMIVGYSHGTDLLGLNGFIGTLIKKYVLKNLDALIVTNSALAEKAKDLGFKKDLLISPMGVDTTLFSKKRRDENVKKNYEANPLLLYAGALIETKGILELLEAFENYRKKNPSSRLLLVGDGYLKDRIKKDGVTVLPPMNHRELSTLIASSDLLLLPSHSEGFSMIVAEAMACETPVIMTENIGIANTMRTEHRLKKDDLIYEVPKKDVQFLEAKIETVLKNRDETKLKAARKFIEENYSWTLVGERIRNFLKH